MSGFCTKCGKPLEEGQEFCGGCGTKVGGVVQTGGYAPPPQQANAQQPYTYVQYYPNPPKKSMLIIILSIVFFLLAGTGAALIFILGPYIAKPAELNGEWDCVMKVDQVVKEYAGFISEDNKGDERDLQMKLTLDKNGKGEMDVSGMLLDTLYKDGKITASRMLDDKLAVTIDATLKKEKEGFTFNGTWKYSIIKGTGKGDVASGPWNAVLVVPGDKENAPSTTQKSQSALPGASATGPNTPVPSAQTQTQSANTGITSADLEGTWKGQLILDAIPGLDQNPNIPEEDKATMRKQIGISSEKLFIFKNGRLWVGEESDSTQITEADMGVLAFGGNSFNADVVTAIGKAHVTGDFVEEGGKRIIKCRLVFAEIPAANSSTQTVTLEASFTGEKQ